MTSLERTFAVKVARIIDKYAVAASKAVEIYGSSALVDAALTDMELDLRRVFDPHYDTTIRLFGNRILNAFKSHAGYETKAEDLFSVEVAHWINNTAAEQVQHVTDTTKRQIRDVISAGFGESLTAPQVASNIVEKVGGVIAKNRAIVISRTETHMAANFGSQQAAVSTGIPMNRVWIAADDERTRETHSQTDSVSHEEPVGMHENFPVVHLLYPGDPSGDPAETINCRCAVGYVTS